jgi:hypothetical protein
VGILKGKMGREEEGGKGKKGARGENHEILERTHHHYTKPPSDQLRQRSGVEYSAKFKNFGRKNHSTNKQKSDNGTRNLSVATMWKVPV